jgi:hypothetical protein
VPGSRVVAVAGIIGALLYLMLDSGVFQAEGAPRVISVSLAIVAAILGVGSWTASMSGQRGRSTMLGGLALGCGAYALLRLLIV